MGFAITSPPSAGSAGSTPIVTPNVIHVTTAGNDTTGDGTLAKPFRTLQHVYDQIGGNTSVVINLGVGGFSVTAHNDWGFNTQIIGAGCLLTNVTIEHVSFSSGIFEIRADHCTVTASYIGAVGVGGNNGDPDGWTTGGNGEGGYNGGSITIVGLCYANNPTTRGGAGGTGGSGVYDSNGEGGGEGGYGGNGGNGGQIILKVIKVTGLIDASGGSEGSGGSSALGNMQPNGSPGYKASILLDNADVLEATTNVGGLPSGYISIARCSYNAGLGYISYDLGGNALF